MTSSVSQEQLKKIEEDPFVLDRILRSIPREILESFDEKQLEGLSTGLDKAFSNAGSKPRHIIDLRTTFSLYFQRFYVVFLLGKDRREKTLTVLEERRRKSTRFARLILLFGFISVLFSALFLAAYVIKCLLGIDLFSDRHLSDLFGS